MRFKVSIIGLSILAVVLAAITSFFIGPNNDVYAEGPQEFHKVIAYPGELDTSIAGVDLWHDYGAFGLYKISGEVLNGLDADQRERIQVTNDMENILIGPSPLRTQTKLPANLPAHLEVSTYEGAGLYLVQFVGPINNDWLLEVERTGAELIHYISNNAYLIWADGGVLNKVEAYMQDGDFLQYVGAYQPYYKIGETLLDRATTLIDSDEVLHIVVQIYDHPEKVVSQEMISELSLDQITAWSSILNYQNAEFLVRVGDIPAIVNLPDVVWVGERLERELNDEVQGQIMAGNLDVGMNGPSGPGYLAWLDGYGFSQDPADYPLVDVTDDGIGNGTVNSGDYTLHEFGSLANPTRLSYVANCTNSSSGEGEDGHGHLNVSIAGGYDVKTGSPYQDGDGFNRGLGINPYGRFGGTRVFDPGWDTSNCSGSDTGLIKSIQDSGAQISSNSWGCSGCAGSYDDSSQAFDVGVRDADLSEPGNQELIFIFSAGNSGSSAGTIGTPGNGKNMTTVGASESDRATWTDGCGISASGADDAMDIIYFSSRGPAPGNRVKPEVIAPGTHIQGTASTNSSYNGSGVCDQYQPTGQTLFAASSGTSHSTPAVSGAASLYYYWLENIYGITPSPAFMKAYLIAHPVYLTGLYANDTLPSNNQGYGMPDMATAFDDTPRILIDQSIVFDNSGETWTFSGTVADPTKPVRIVLAYTDKAGVIGTSPQVNNLNLSANIDGSTYLGNHFSGQWSTTGGTSDSANNYEAVFLPPGTTGNIEITITGFNIADDGIPNTGDATDQDFALVCYNCTEGDSFSLDVNPDNAAICTPEDGLYEVTVSQIYGDPSPVTLSLTGNPPGTTVSFYTNPVTPSGSSALSIGNTGAAGAGNYSLDVVGVTPTKTLTVTVGLDVFTVVPGTVVLQTPVNQGLDQSYSPTLIWSGVSQAISYTLEVGLDEGFATVVYSDVVPGISHGLGIELEPSTWYYWRVRAENVCGTGPISEIFRFRTIDVPPVLLVDDDDNAPNVKSYYTDALDTLGIPYALWDTGNSDIEPAIGDLNPHDIVIWFSGGERGGFAGPGVSAESALGNWLDSGGVCFFISSQDYFNDHGLTSFMQNYLGVESITERRLPSKRYTSVIGGGSVFDGLGAYTLGYPFTDYPDEVNPDGTADIAFVGNNAAIAGINKGNSPYKSTFWGFPFEALPTAQDRQETLNTFFDWCTPHQVFLPFLIR
jgi:hypothetical protein